MKKLMVAGIVLLVLLVIGAGVVWHFMTKPMYEPGMVAASQDWRSMVSAQPTAAGDWTMEPGITLHHFEQGAGRNVLIVHGGPGKPFPGPLPALEPLAGRFRFVYYDQRGSGKSSRPIDKFASSNYYENMKVLEKKLGLTAQLGDIERIRRILGEEKLILVGHSFGAFQAALYAAEFPDKVQALVLVAPASTLVMPDPEGDFFAAVGRLLPEELKKEYVEYLKAYLDYRDIFSKSDADLVALNMGFDKYYRAAAAARNFAVPASATLVNAGGWMVEAMYFSMGKRHDYRPSLKNVTAPVLILHGEKDIQPESASRAYANALPNAEVRVIKNAGHFMFEDAPEAFAKAAGDFLSQAAGDRSLSGLKSQ